MTLLLSKVIRESVKRWIKLLLILQPKAVIVKDSSTRLLRFPVFLYRFHYAKCSRPFCNSYTPPKCSFNCIACRSEQGRCNNMRIVYKPEVYYDCIPKIQSVSFCIYHGSYHERHDGAGTRYIY